MPEDAKIKILLLSDQVVDRIYNEHIRRMFPDVDLILSCGDLPYYYLEYVLDILNRPLYFVHGNHDSVVEHGSHGERRYPWGAENLHRRVMRHKGLIMLGFEGSIRYSRSRYQYTQFEAWVQVLSKLPRLFWNRLVHGRALDILLTHSPAYQIGDREDPPHRGFIAYRWLIEKFKPRFHFHGHIHRHDHRRSKPMKYQDTMIVNACPYQVVEIDPGDFNG